eukprot:CAMPEP_0177794532 /NCGR_PEP_ID=MMETSP0491_2-20121128/25704_1 /TAXON_ID=63592 /ORGANISM="Tetraselmis chuii, Strain PLY429" /LENGTH=533 /DNA_ID=CAMNT_0019317211 /DNA_START=8 /DNA_END=1609 /DNA_ORIENTATION=-
MKLRVRSLTGSLYLEDGKLNSSSTVKTMLDNAAAASAEARCGALPSASAEARCGALPAEVQMLRVLHKGRTLEWGQCLGAAGVQEGDTLVVLEKRAPPAPAAVDDTPPPDLETVNRITLADAKERFTSGASVPGHTLGRLSAAAPRRLSNEGIPTSLRDMESHLQSLLNAVEGLNSSMQVGSSRRQPPRSGRASSTGVAPVDEGEEEAEEAEPAPLPEPSASHLAQLMEMGFDEEAVKKALLLNNNHLELAMDWLLVHAGDADASTPLTEQQLREISRRRPRRQRVNLSGVGPSRGAAIAEQNDALPSSPPAELLDTLAEMGFERPQASAALQAFGNNMEMACHWLLTAGSRPGALPPDPLSRQNPSRREPTARPADSLSEGGDMEIALPSVEGETSGEVVAPPVARSGSLEVETPYGNPNNESRHTLLSSFEGDDADSAHEPLDVQLNSMQSFLESVGVDAVSLGELLQNPVIQHALRDERVMQAFQEMMRNPSTAHRYLADPEVGPALLQVHRHLGNDNGMPSFGPSLDDD